MELPGGSPYPKVWTMPRPSREGLACFYYITKNDLVKSLARVPTPFRFRGMDPFRERTADVNLLTEGLRLPSIYTPMLIQKSSQAMK